MGFVDQLGLTDIVRPVDKREPASKVRLIYSHGSLHRLPTNLIGLLTSKAPVMEGLIPSLLREPFIRTRLGEGEDTSVHEFVARRLGSKVAFELVSALVHGIYAGDSSKLSVRATFKSLVELEAEHGSLIRGLLARASRPEDPQLAAAREELMGRNPKLGQVYQNASMYSFAGGIEQLTFKLKRELQGLPNMEILLDSPATKLEFGAGVKVHATIRGQPQVIEAEHVIGAIPGPSLQKLIDYPVEELTFNPSVDVAVVSLAFSKKVLPWPAFGYLVPRSVTDSLALGVVFDSCSFPSESPGREVLTVMMGGHRFRKQLGDPAALSSADLLHKARQVIEQHLGISDAPLAHQATLQRQCIPQYLVDHPRRMNKLHGLLQAQFGSKLSVAGASYTGVAINDCRRPGFHLPPNPVTGLELYKTLG
ncbi:oxygen-dependent protoporphyrinogen oxidase [Massospora cicadina]|nr:oxygen-dependent protoporphyrinogen oxidase [Massospora cicadina]